MTTIYVGSSVAPTLSDAKLGEYKSLVNELPKEFQQPVSLLHNYCDAWKGGGTVVPLAKEIESCRQSLASIEVDATDRNSEEIIEWQYRVKRAVVEKHFPEAEQYQKMILAFSGGTAWLEVLSPSERKRMEEFLSLLKICGEEVAMAYRSKSYPNIPYPKLEATALRDAAFHLLWHGVELSNGREPRTNKS